MPDIETPDEDADEQARPVADPEPQLVADDPTPEADAADLAEQLREVPIDDDDYR
jgi:hypothetical protein